MSEKGQTVYQSQHCMLHVYVVFEAVQRHSLKTLHQNTTCDPININIIHVTGTAEMPSRAAWLDVPRRAPPPTSQTARDRPRHARCAHAALTAFAVAKPPPTISIKRLGSLKTSSNANSLACALGQAVGSGRSPRGRRSS